MSPRDTHKGGRKVPLSDLPELTPWLEQTELKQQLLAESGGGEAFVALAAPMLKRSILGVDPSTRLSTNRGQLKALLRRSVSVDEITHAFAEAWLTESDILTLPRRAWSDRPVLVYGIPLLILGAALITTALVVFQAHPRWMGPFIYTAPVFMLAVAPLLWLLIRAWRRTLRGADAVLARPSTQVVDLVPSEALGTDQPQTALALDTQAVESLTPQAAEAPSSSTQSVLEAEPALSSNPATPETNPSKPPIEPPPESTMTDQTQTLSIDGTEYNPADLSNAAQQQLTNLRICDQEIQRLQQQLAIAQTARGAYANALKAELPNTTTH